MTEYTIIKELLAPDESGGFEVDGSIDCEVFDDEDEAREKAVLLNTENEDQNVRFCIRVEHYKNGMLSSFEYIEHDEL